MAKKRILTGITPTGVPHIGNYIGMYKPALARQDSEHEALYFIADYHSLVKCWEPQARQDFIYQVAASWLALGLDPNKTVFYRQSQVPEIAELSWILSTVAAKGLLNRAHAYKDQVAKNTEAGEDPDHAITMGLFCYPVLMAADILAFNANLVPVGKDQAQHMEIARDIAARFNHVYGETFVLPEALIDDTTPTLPGLDGRKMSKSYGNTIPLFEPANRLRKLVMKIKTNSQPPEEPKETEGCTLFEIYRAFASESEVADIKKRYTQGIGWGEMKQILFEKLDQELSGPREKYEALIQDTAGIQKILDQGAQKARDLAAPIFKNVYRNTGLIKGTS